MMNIMKKELQHLRNSCRPLKNSGVQLVDSEKSTEKLFEIKRKNS